MSSPVQPVADVASEYAHLAGRITKHLQAHPTDAQARADLRYVVSQMKGPTAAANAQDATAASGPPNPHPVAAALSGISKGLLDIPGGILNAAIHPGQTLEGLASMNPLDPSAIGAVASSFRDPEASLSERLASIVQHTPLNLGYAPERALLEATGAKSDTPASAPEQWRRGTNVASLALLGVNPKTAFRLATRPVRSAVGAAFGPLLDRLAPAAAKAAPAAAAVAAGTADELAVAKALGVPVDMVRGRVGQAAVAARAAAAPSAGLLDVPVPKPVEPIPGTGGYGFTAEGPPTPPVSTAPTIREMQQGLLGGNRGVGGHSYVSGGLSGGTPSPVSPLTSAMPLQQLQMLVRLPADQFEAAAAWFPKAILDQLRALRASQPGLLTP